MDPINIPPTLAYIYIYHTWILWEMGGYPKLAGWFISGKIHRTKWMMTGVAL